MEKKTTKSEEERRSKKLQIDTFTKLSKIYEIKTYIYVYTLSNITFASCSLTRQ